jgi:hypothetical protein
MSGGTKPRVKRKHASKGNPVARLFHRLDLEAQGVDYARALQKLATSIKLRMFAFDDGADATDLLADLMETIGPTTETFAQQYGAHVPKTRQLHGALRTVQAMCLAGYKWDARYAESLDVALDMAFEIPKDLDPFVFADSLNASQGLAQVIRDHTLKDDDIAAKIT